MSDGINKEIVLHCLKSASDFHDEICEECQCILSVIIHGKAKCMNERLS